MKNKYALNNLAIFSDNALKNLMLKKYLLLLWSTPVPIVDLATLLKIHDERTLSCCSSSNRASCACLTWAGWPVRSAYHFLNASALVTNSNLVNINKLNFTDAFEHLWNGGVSTFIVERTTRPLHTFYCRFMTLKVTVVISAFFKYLSLASIRNNFIFWK